MGVGSCVKPIPTWDGEIYVGVPEHDAIERVQSTTQPSISCQEEQFRGYLCMSAEDFESFIQTYVYGCKQWRGGVDTKPAYEVYKDVF
jgi:hypothetical protein